MSCAVDTTLCVWILYNFRNKERLNSALFSGFTQSKIVSFFKSIFPDNISVTPSPVKESKKTGPKLCPEKSVGNYDSTLRKVPKKNAEIFYTSAGEPEKAQTAFIHGHY